MKKNVSKLLALIVALVMMLGCAACSNNDTPAETGGAPAETGGEPAETGGTAAEAENWLIGANIWGTGVPMLELLNEASLYAIDNFGCTSMNVSDDYTSDLIVQNMQKFVGAEVDGANVYCNTATTLPRVIDIFTEAQTPFSLHTGIGTEDQFSMLTECEYFAGSVDADCILAGAQLAQLAWDDGCRTAVMIGGNIGDTNHDQRSQGFRETFEGLGGTVLDEARCTDASEATTKAGDLLSANREADCIYCFVGDYVPGSVTASENLGISDHLKIYVSNVDSDSASLIKEGVVAGGNDGTTLPPMLGASLVINYLDGYKIVDENGLACHFQTTPIVVTSENVDLYMDVFCVDGQQPIADSVMESLMGRYNPETGYDTYMDVIENQLTLENLAAALGVG